MVFTSVIFIELPGGKNSRSPFDFAPTASGGKAGQALHCVPPDFTITDKKQKMQVQQNKYESQGARFMPPWVGEAGGQLT
jgi:hypothetical protein